MEEKNSSAICSCRWHSFRQPSEMCLGWKKYTSALDTVIMCYYYKFICASFIFSSSWHTPRDTRKKKMLSPFSASSCSNNLVGVCVCAQFAIHFLDSLLSKKINKKIQKKRRRSKKKFGRQTNVPCLASAVFDNIVYAY